MDFKMAREINWHFNSLLDRINPLSILFIEISLKLKLLMSNFYGKNGVVWKLTGNI